MTSENFKSLDQVTRDGIKIILCSHDVLVRNQELQTSLLNVTIREQRLRQFLKSLKYTDMGARFEQIKESHEKTFEWIFKDPETTTRPWSNFAEWLQSDESLYWINGKAGSGKSTLMAFLQDHRNTRTFLAKWADNIPLCKGFFYFWNSGGLAQRTQNGMLRSLLHQILSQNPNLISIVAPEYEEQINRDWNDRALKEMFDKVCTQDSIPMKVFLLVDGLDEHDGDHHEMAKFFQKLAKLPNMKICVSSRPLPVFDLAFKDSPLLQLQNLTYRDMKIYVHDKLLNDPILNQMQRSDSKDVRDLIDAVVRRAEGVFLWVTLTCSSLISGLVAGDHLSDLRSRVDACPKKLEGLYAHMLEQIEPLYKEHASRLFQIMHAHYKIGIGYISARRFRFAGFSVDKVIASEISPVDLKQAESDLKSLDLCLKSRCTGLLELIDNPSITDDEYSGADEMVKVEWIHRTAREFLEKEGSKALLGDHQIAKAFDPYLALLGSQVMHIKTLNPVQQIERIRKEHERGGPLYHLMTVFYLMGDVMRFARLTSPESTAHMVQLVDEVDRVVTIHWERWLEAQVKVYGKHVGPRYTDYFSAYWRLGHDLNIDRKPPRAFICDPESSILKLAVQFGVRSYIEVKMAANPDKLTLTSGRPLLHYAAQPIVGWKGDLRWYAPHLDTLRLLLEAGCDPHETWHGMSVWETLLFKWEELMDSRTAFVPIFDELPFWDFFMVLVEHRSRGTVDTPRRLTAIVKKIRRKYQIAYNYGKEEMEKLEVSEELDNKLEKVLEGLARNNAKNNQLPMPSTFQVLWWLITSGRFDFLK